MTEHHDVVVGGGQAGLAIGYLLGRQGREVTILEAADTPAAAWRTRWDSLKLFTPVRYDSLPGRAFPGDPDAYPRRDDVVAYLTDYARGFELPVELNSAVHAVRRGDRGHLVELDDRTYEAEHVVVATGPFQIPRVPAIAEHLDRDVVQFHSSAYRTSRDLDAGRVLVVGGGNTGFQIAEELSRTHEVHLSIGTRQIPLPQRIGGRDLFRYLEATGLMGRTANSPIGRRMQGRETLIGSSPRAARRRHGIRLCGRTVDISGPEVMFSDGARLEPDTVIWATGFGLDHSWIHEPVFDAGGHLVHRRGVTASPGLYFLGLPWQHTRGSALLGWVKDDAEFLADLIGAMPTNAVEPGQRRGCAGDASGTVSRPAATASFASRPAIRAPMLWGIAVGLLQATTPLVFWWLDNATVYALGLVGIAFVYVGFAVADGRAKVIAIESSVTFAFVVIAAAAVTGSPWLLVVGFVGHGLKDLWQHRSHFVANTRWWPPFCMIVDWVVAAIIVGEIAAGLHFG